MPLAKAHGAALIALTIDEVGMAKTAERKVEIAKRIREIACDEHGLDPEALIFDALTFTLTTGDEEWRPSAVETIEGIRRIKAEIPGREDLARRLQRLLRRLAAPRARSSTRSSCTTASRPGSTWRWSTPTTSPPTREISEEERELTDDLVFNRREDALERFIAHFESKGEEAEAGGRRPDRGHGARGGPALAHPAPQEGRASRTGSTARWRRSAPSRPSTRCCCRR